jgi:uncharacterized membrane protein YphA (DoxX/SURF4 family)
MTALSAPDLERRAASALPGRLRAAIERLDRSVTSLLDHWGVTVLRVSLAVVFIWFGVLKVAGRSPVEDLVADTVYWLPGRFVVPAIGVWEIVVGVGLLVPVALRLTLLLFWAQMAGTLLVLATQPGESFQGGNPLLLTVTGEFVVKNLVLIAAGLVVGSTVRRRAGALDSDRETA